MSAMLSMCFAVIAWSLYPLAAVMSLKTMTGLELVLVTTFFSAIGITIIALVRFIRRNKLAEIIQKHKELEKSTYITILISGITNVVCHACFFAALSMSHKGGVSLLYESWPIIAVIATPFLIKKAWKEVSFKEFMVSLIALVGMGIIILSNEDIDLPFFNSKDLNHERDYVALLGYVLAFIGAYSCAMCVVLKGLVAEHYGGAANGVGTTIISEFYSRVISVIIMLVVFFVMKDQINLVNIDWFWSLFISICVMVMGGILYTYALINTDRPTIHILYYLVPFFAVFSLWMAGETTTNTGLFVGGAIIIACNIYLYYAGRRADFVAPPL